MTSGPSSFLREPVRSWSWARLWLGNLNLSKRRRQRLLASHIYQITHGHVEDCCDSVQGIQSRIPFTTFQLSQKPGCDGVGSHIQLSEPAKPASFPYIVPDQPSESREIHVFQATRSRPLVSVHYRDDNACRNHPVEFIFEVWRAMRMQRVAAVTVMTVLGRHGWANVAVFSQRNAACGTGSKFHSKDAAVFAPEVNTQQGTGETQC